MWIGQQKRLRKRPQKILKIRRVVHEDSKIISILEKLKLKIVDAVSGMRSIQKDTVERPSNRPTLEAKAWAPQQEPGRLAYVYQLLAKMCKDVSWFSSNYRSQAHRLRTFLLAVLCIDTWASQVALGVKNSPAKAGDLRDASSIPGLGRSPGEGYNNLLQYSCQENPTTDEPRTEEPDSPWGLHRVGHNWSDLARKHVFKNT